MASTRDSRPALATRSIRSCDSKHDLVGGHALFALGYACDIDRDAGPSASRKLGGRAGQSRGAHVLNRDQRIGAHQFEASLEEEFLHEGISDLNGRSLLFGRFIELGGRHGRAMDSVLAGLGADIEDRIALSFCAREEDPILGGDPETKSIHQGIEVVAIFEGHLASDGRYAGTVPIRRDARDNTSEEGAVLGNRERTEGAASS